MAPPRITLEERFWAKVRKTDSCWLWTGGVCRNGLPYGRLSLPGREAGQVLAHRYSYELHKGPPGDLCVCHECDNASCVNPDHLFLGTYAENMADCVKKGRFASHPGEKNGMAKLSEKDIRAIRSDSREHKSIARDYGIWPQGVSAIKRRVVWASVP